MVNSQQTIDYYYIINLTLSIVHFPSTSRFRVIETFPGISQKSNTEK